MKFRCPTCKDLNGGFLEYRGAREVFYCKECGAKMAYPCDLAAQMEDDDDDATS